jgi:putative ABC transport system substrate-binding protein
MAIFAMGPPSAFAAKDATTTIPIVYIAGLDPVAAGLVSSLNRPTGNVTGIVPPGFMALRVRPSRVG